MFSAIGIDPEEDLAELHRLRRPRHSTSRITPVISASISFMIFIASMMQTVWPEVTRLPTFTYGSAPGSGAL